MDSGAKEKDLLRRFGSKSAVHPWLTQCVRDGVIERLMRDAGELVEERDGFRIGE